jgi:hypothetical protein
VSVLLGAIADGAGLLTWRQDAFAYADGVEESSGRFVGLRTGPGIVLSDPVGLLVRPDTAEAQFDSEQPERPSPDAPPPDGEAGSGDGAGSPGGTTGSTGEQVLRRFFGAVALDPTRLSRDASEIGEAVVAHLNGLVGAEVQVSLEIHAAIPGGVPEDVVRTVTENAMTLRFDSATGFEPD